LIRVNEESVATGLAEVLAGSAEGAVAAVFRLLGRHVSHGEIEDIRHSMKKPLRELWPAG
jgi:uncharacterized protein (DUF2267 family)